MNTAGITGSPVLSAYDKEIYDRADALLRQPLELRRQILQRIERDEGLDVANDIKAEIRRVWDERR